MKILFVNTREPKCGVHQYGRSLYYVLQHRLGIPSQHSIHYGTFDSKEHFLEAYLHVKPDVTIYNWQAGIGGWMSEAPFAGMGRQVLAYHDLEANFSQFDAILFSDPTMKQHDNWYPIGRPLRHQIYMPIRMNANVPVIGINGFIGAWAELAFSHIANHFDRAHIRMHLPYAVYGDGSGIRANAAASECRQALPEGFTMEVSHDFMEWDDLVMWLAKNDINCYIRDPAMHWRGVSSACDAAMCARRPIAVNSCDAFRHLHDCSPSIMVEHRTIPEIMQGGLSPLIKKYEDYSHEVVSEQVLKVLESVVDKA